MRYIWVHLLYSGYSLWYSLCIIVLLWWINKTTIALVFGGREMFTSAFTILSVGNFHMTRVSWFDACKLTLYFFARLLALCFRLAFFAVLYIQLPSVSSAWSPDSVSEWSDHGNPLQPHNIITCRPYLSTELVRIEQLTTESDLIYWILFQICQ